MPNFENNFGTNLTSNTAAGATTSPVNAIPTVDAPYYIAFDATNINAHYEVAYITSDTATNINHAATTYDHTTAEEVRMIVPASYLTAMQELEEGEMRNGKISVTDAAGITVALKTQDGGDPSVTEPVFVKIGGTVRAITAALSVAKADGTNWCNAGSAELATKEIDYFSYLGYNATDGVVIGFSRYPGASSYDDFSATTTNEKYCAISTITTAAATDYYNVIGRFAATLSAGAGYTWSVPAFTAKNLIQRPIYETRELDWVPTRAVASGTAPTYTAGDVNKYQLIGNKLFFHEENYNTSGGTAGNGTNRITTTLPFACSSNITGYSNLGFGFSFEESGTIGLVTITTVTNSSTFQLYLSTAANIVGNDQSSAARYLSLRGFYEI